MFEAKDFHSSSFFVQKLYFTSFINSQPSRKNLQITVLDIPILNVRIQQFGASNIARRIFEINYSLA